MMPNVELQRHIKKNASLFADEFNPLNPELNPIC